MSGFDGRQYLREFGGAMALYAVTVVAAGRIYDRYEPEGYVALGLALAPMIPTALALWAFLRQFWRMDELQRRVVSEAMLIAAGAVGFVSFALGWVLVALKPQHVLFQYLPMLLILPAMILVWGVALPLVGRRYR